MAKLIFDFERRPSAIFGSIYRPVAVVDWWSDFISNWVGVVMLVDTGADLCILPRYYGAKLGLDVAHGERFVVRGIGGRTSISVFRKQRIRLGRVEMVVPVGIMNQDNTTPIMGRQRLIESIKCTIHKHQTRFEH